jgi:hypothetical protein
MLAKSRLVKSHAALMTKLLIYPLTAALILTDRIAAKPPNILVKTGLLPPHGSPNSLKINAGLSL